MMRLWRAALLTAFSCINLTLSSILLEALGWILLEALGWLSSILLEALGWPEHVEWLLLESLNLDATRVEMAEIPVELLAVGPPLRG